MTQPDTPEDVLEFVEGADFVFVAAVHEDDNTLHTHSFDLTDVGVSTIINATDTLARKYDEYADQAAALVGAERD